MRSCTINIANMGFGCFADIHFDDMPDNGPGDSVLNVIAPNEESALASIKSCIEGNIPPKLMPPCPNVTVYDEEGLKSLTLEQFEQATRKHVKGLA